MRAGVHDSDVDQLRRYPPGGRRGGPPRRRVHHQPTISAVLVASGPGAGAAALPRRRAPPASQDGPAGRPSLVGVVASLIGLGRRPRRGRGCCGRTLSSALLSKRWDLPSSHARGHTPTVAVALPPYRRHGPVSAQAPARRASRAAPLAVVAGALPVLTGQRRRRAPRMAARGGLACGSVSACRALRGCYRHRPQSAPAPGRRAHPGRRSDARPVGGRPPLVRLVGLPVARCSGCRANSAHTNVDAQPRPDRRHRLRPDGRARARQLRHRPVRPRPKRSSMRRSPVRRPSP